MANLFATIMRDNITFVLQDRTLKKKDILTEYCTHQGVADKEAFGHLPSGGSLLESNATNTLTWLIKAGTIKSPKRGVYQMVEGVAPATAFTKHALNEETHDDAETSQETLPSLEEYLEEQPLHTLEHELMSTLEFHPLHLKYTLQSGEVVEGKFMVSRTPDAFVITQKGRKDSVLVPVNDLVSTDPEIQAFADTVKNDFDHAGSHKGAANRLLKMLLICGLKHEHEDPLAGFVAPCPDLCPIQELWAGKAQIIKESI
jgi:hypothetical protein